MREQKRALSTWQRLLLLLLAVGGFAQITYWAVVAEGIEKPLAGICASWDRDASVGIALLVPVPTALAESQLDQALSQLRRARKNCRAGWLDIARRDYASLRDAYRFPSRPPTHPSDQGSKP
jgi:hypothetical protein